MSITALLNDLMPQLTAFDTQKTRNATNVRLPATVGKVAGLVAGEGLEKHRGLHHCILLSDGTVLAITGPEHCRASLADAKRLTRLWNAAIGTSEVAA